MSGPPTAVDCSTPQSLAESKAAHTSSLVLIVLCPAIAIAFVTLRLWSRTLMKTFGWDDALILIALALSIADAGATWKFTQISYGGYHSCDIPPLTLDDVRDLNMWLLIQQLLYNPILVFVKASVLLFLMRFQDNRWFIKRSLQGFFVANVMLGVSIFLADLFQCTPIRYMYDSIMMDINAQIQAGANPATGLTPDGKLIKAGHCINQTAFVISSAAITTVTEALTLLIPMAMVWDLKINKRKKIIIVTILSLGWIVVAVSIARLVIFSRLLDPTTVDASYGVQNQMSSIETNLAIVVACAPALKALTKRLAPRFLSSKGYGNNYYDGYGKQSSAANAGSSYARRSFHPTTSAQGRRYGNSRTKDSDDDISVTIDERTESQEKIFRPSDGIEKTVHINIEMDDLSESQSRSQSQNRNQSQNQLTGQAKGPDIRSGSGSPDWR